MKSVVKGMKSPTLCFHYRNMSMFLKSIALSRLPCSLTACWGALEPGSWEGPWARNYKDLHYKTLSHEQPRSLEARCSEIPIFQWKNYLKLSVTKFSQVYLHRRKKFLLRQEGDRAVFSCLEFTFRNKGKQLQLCVRGSQLQDYMQKFLLPLVER